MLQVREIFLFDKNLFEFVDHRDFHQFHHLNQLELHHVVIENRLFFDQLMLKDENRDKGN